MPQDWVDVMRDEDDGGIEFATLLINEFAHCPLMLKVEGEERFVAEQQFRVARDCLTDTDALLLAARECRDGRGRVIGGSHRFEHGIDPAPKRRGRDRQTPAVSVDTKCDKVACPERRPMVEELLLRDIADIAIAASNRTSEDLDRARRERLLPENCLEHARLAGAVRTEDGEELAGFQLEVESAPEWAITE